MAKNKIEIKITQDSSKRKVDLEAMPIDVAKAFLILFESLTKIAELTKGGKDLKITIKKGSAAVCVEDDKVSNILSDFNTVIENNSTNKELVEHWRNIQTVFSENGLTYEGIFLKDNKIIPMFQVLKTRQPLRAKKIRKKPIQSKVKFFTGQLNAVGGKYPNIHVDMAGNVERILIGCTQTQAIKAKAFLYDKIYFSAWEIEKENTDVKEYILCDSYFQTQLALMNNFSTFINDMNNADNEIEALKMLHYESRKYLDKKDYKNFRKFLRLFNNECSDVNVLNTLLILTQGLKDNEDLSTMIASIDNILGNKLYKKKRIKVN